MSRKAVLIRFSARGARETAPSCIRLTAWGQSGSRAKRVVALVAIGAILVTGAFWTWLRTADDRLIAAVRDVQRRTGFHQMTSHDKEVVWRFIRRAERLTDRCGGRLQELSESERRVVQEAVRDGFLGGLEP